MTEMNTVSSKGLTHDETSLIIGKDRSNIALQAAAEIEVLTDLMRVATNDPDTVHLSMRGLSLRVRDLSQVIMSALSDESDTTEAIAYRLLREGAEPEEV